jgi:hypothetical protein
MNVVSGAYTSTGDAPVTLEQQRVRVLELRSLDAALRQRVHKAAERLERELVTMLDPHWRRDDADADEFVLQSLQPAATRARVGRGGGGGGGGREGGSSSAASGGGSETDDEAMDLEWAEPTALTPHEALSLGPAAPPTALERLLRPVQPLVNTDHIARAAYDHKVRRLRILKLGYDTLRAARAAPEAAVTAAATAQALSASRQRSGAVNPEQGALAAEPDTAALSLLASPLRYRVGRGAGVSEADGLRAPRAWDKQQAEDAAVAVRRAKASIRRIEAQAEAQLRIHTDALSLKDAEALLAARSTGEVTLDPTETLAANLAQTVAAEKHKLAASASWLNAGTAGSTRR